MARVTVEDCLLVVPDRFELVVLASQRTRSINSGASVTLPRDGDKSSVVSLREIAGGTVQADHLREGVVQSFQRYIEGEETDSDLREPLDEEATHWIQTELDDKQAERLGFSEESPVEEVGPNPDDLY